VGESAVKADRQGQLTLLKSVLARSWWTDRGDGALCEAKY